MSENLKDLIDKAEEDEKTTAQLEKTVENLELKVAKLETKLKEKEEEPKIVLEKAPMEEIESEEIKILKNLINSQNQELTQRNREKEALHMKIKDLNTELINLKESINDSIKDQVIMKTQNSLNTLIEDYGRLENMNKNLKEKILEIEVENDSLRETAEVFATETSNVEELEYKMSRLNKQLNDLREENKLLENSNLTLQNRELSVDNLENTLRQLESINNELKKENQKLTTKLDTVKAERFQLTKFEAKVSNLEKEIKN
jgi:chromosome segregation ATPase